MLFLFLNSHVHCFVLFLNYRLDHEAFTSNESEAFVYFASGILSDFLPFIVQCLEAIFPDAAFEHLVLTSSYAVFHHLPQALLLSKAKVELNMHIDAQLVGEPLKDIISSLKADKIEMADVEKQPPEIVSGCIIRP